MAILAFIGAMAALGLAAGGQWIMAIVIYAAAGAAWTHHDRARPLGEMPMWVAGGSLVHGLVWALWPLRAIEAGLQWRGRLRSAERFSVGPERRAQSYASLDEALTRARELAGASGQAVPIVDRAWLVRADTSMRGPRKHWTAIVEADGSVDRHRHPMWWW